MIFLFPEPQDRSEGSVTRRRKENAAHQPDRGRDERTARSMTHRDEPAGMAEGRPQSPNSFGTASDSADGLL